MSSAAASDTSSAPASVTGTVTGGRRRSGTSVKTLKRVLKKAGLKVSGKKATLTRRAKKAHLMRGGEVKPVAEVKPIVEKKEEEVIEGGKRRRGSKKSKGFRLY
jgi:hypothetical protein